MTLTTVAVPDAVADAVVYFAAVVAVARLDRKQFPLVNLPLMQIPPGPSVIKTFSVRNLPIFVIS